MKARRIVLRYFIDMNTVKVSPKYQVVIPREVRSRLSIAAGDRLQVIPVDGRIELIPVPKSSRLRGIARGIDTSVEREKADRV